MPVTTDDTGRVYKFTASGDAIGSTVFVRSWRWVGATTAGDTLSLQDASGNEIATSEADGANFIDGWPVGYYVANLTAASMTTGELFVYSGAPYRGIGLTKDGG